MSASCVDSDNFAKGAYCEEVEGELKERKMDKRAELINRLEHLIADTEWSDIVDLSPQDAKDILKLLKQYSELQERHRILVDKFDDLLATLKEQSDGLKHYDDGSTEP